MSKFKDEQKEFWNIIILSAAKPIVKPIGRAIGKEIGKAIRKWIRS